MFKNLKINNSKNAGSKITPWQILIDYLCFWNRVIQALDCFLLIMNVESG
jgi:hypothetical protein